jgi:hypothetical protein
MYDEMKLDENLLDNDNIKRDSLTVNEGKKFDSPDIGKRHKARKTGTNLVVSVR